MAKYKVALLSVFAPEVVAEIERHLPEDFELVAMKNYEEREKLDVASNADFLLCGKATATAEVMDVAPNLKLIQKWGIGVDSIDLKAAAARGIPVTITAGGNSVAVAELAIALMLSVYRRVPFVDRSMRQGRWLQTENRARAFQLNGKTVGIVGLGNIGRQVARRLRAFNTRVLYYDIKRPGAELEEQLGVEFRPLDEVFAESDILTFHVPLTDLTRDMVDARAFSLMKPNAVVINTCRGEVVDQSALIEALRSGRIMGAGQDVFPQEPIESDNPLLKMDNVVLTSHIGGGVMDNVANEARHSFSNMVKVLKGEPLPEADVIVGR